MGHEGAHRGGTLALSGGVAGAIIMAMASIVVYAVFAKAR